jgi:predicted Zn-dependent protease
MRTTLRFLVTSLVLVGSVAVAAPARRSPGEPPDQQKPAASAAPSPAIRAMELELTRSMDVLKAADPAPYYIGYTITEQRRAEVQGSNGALLESEEARNRWLEVQVRVGSYELDNTRKVGDRAAFTPGGATPIPFEDDVPVIRRVIWLETDRQYRAAAQALIKIQTGKEVKVQTAEGEAPDFSREEPQKWFGPEASFQVDRKPWEARVRKFTEAFRQYPHVFNSIATFSVRAENQYQVTSEGTRLQFGDVRYRLELFIQGKASDGMDINRYYNFDWADAASTPDEKTILARCQTMAKELEALTQAPLVEPFAGPVLLSGRAAAVFFHEVFGHPVEGHRQKDITEGQTFTRKVGELVLPDFISVYDDPTQSRAASSDLLGHYSFDDEGVAARRVTLVEKGILRNFLLSRSPLVGFPTSNGHGRRQIGSAPVARQGNLIIQSSRTVTNAKLRALLIEEIRRQGKPFGLLIDDLEGGFTFTGRSLPQAFQLLPLVVYRVYADGRPDELVRGVDIAGTRLIALNKIVATGDTPEVFNGYCGAESGYVPVSAVAPAILISEIEVQKKETSTDKPPILPPPAHDPQGRRP